MALLFKFKELQELVTFQPLETEVIFLEAVKSRGQTCQVADFVWLFWLFSSEMSLSRMHLAISVNGGTRSGSGLRPFLCDTAQCTAGHE